MKTPRILPILFLCLLPLLQGCGDSMSPEPLGAQTADLAEIQALLGQVITRLDSLEARTGRSDSTLSAQVAEIAGIVGASGPEGSLSGSAVLEASLCGAISPKAVARFRSSVTLRGQAEGMLGVDAYGNGATGELKAFSGQMVSLIPSGGVSGQLQLCAKLSGGGTVGTGASGSGEGPAGVIDPSDPVYTLLRGITENVGTSGLSSLASGLGMDGSRLGTALDAMSSFSLSQAPFGGGGASGLVNALPLPSDLASTLNNPSGIFDQASEAATYAVDQICGQALRVGEFADLVQSGCDLRDQVPAPGTVIDIFSGLDGLPGQVQTLQTAMGSVCNTVGSITDKTLVIPSRSITILGNDYTTFPGYSAALFPGFAHPNC
ncbi:MAG: hypothetical protein PVJ80_02090 [Gemmatimonadota bacterium]